MLKALKQQVLHAARGTRLFEAVADSRWRQRRLLILAYHSLAVDEEHEWRRALFFTRREFEERLDLIGRARLNVLPLGEAVERLRAGTLPPRSAALTFDDGSADFASLVVPALRERGYPATVYATTYYGERRLPIFFLMVSYVLWKARRRRLAQAPDLGVMAGIDLADATRREAVAQSIVAAADAAGLTAEEKALRVRRVAELAGVDYADLIERRVLHQMTPDELRAVAAAGMDVQLHTHRHRVPREREEFAREIVDNRTRLEQVSGRPAIHFCYPSGVYFPESPGWLAGLGVVTATTCVPGLASRTSSPLLLPRLVDTAGLSTIEFEGWLSGVSHLLPRRVSWTPHD